MCDIIYKPAEQQIYKKTLKKVWDMNSDGAGLAYNQNGRVLIDKGYMTFKEFWKALKPHQDKDLIIHFRWSTSGITNKGQTHPFPLSQNNRILTARKLVCHYALAHNGIMQSFGNKKVSDTMDFIKRILQGARFNQKMMLLNYKVDRSNCFALLTGQKIYLLGDFTDVEGCLHSSLTWRFSASKTSWSNCSWNHKTGTWDDNYDYTDEKKDEFDTKDICPHCYAPTIKETPCANCYGSDAPDFDLGEDKEGLPMWYNRNI